MVTATYDQVARDPDGDFHFHRGPDYAATMLSYEPSDLARLPALSTARFAGVGNPHRIGPIAPGETVVDVGSGAGTDLLLAALRVGPRGRAIGVDPTPAMRACAGEGARKLGVEAIVDLRPGTSDALPIEDESVDVGISNGVINLAPDKLRAFSEIHRVLKPGGRLYLADVSVARELKLDARADIDLWAA